jgi:hypothetical protein
MKKVIDLLTAPETPKVYLIVHELFGIFMSSNKMTLVTPFVSHPDPSNPKLVFTHKYILARFKDGTWQRDLLMNKDDHYTIDGVVLRSTPATSLPCHAKFSPHPCGKFSLSRTHKSHVTWELPIPKHIHQLRTVAIPETCRQLFSGDPHGDAIDAQLNGISLVHVFEYDMDPESAVRVNVKNGDSEPTPVKIDCRLDTDSNSINLHLWAQLENEAGMTDPDDHSQMASRALVALFEGIHIDPGAHSLSIDNLYPTQASTPFGVRLPELMTLAEKKHFFPGRDHARISCTARTCGHGGNLYVDSV